MTLIYTDDAKQVWSTILNETPTWVLPFSPQPYPCMIYAGHNADPRFIAEVGLQLIASGCVFVVCAGKDCEQWHDTIDGEIISAQARGSLDTEKLILTTWHPKDTLEELVFFFMHTTFDANMEEHPGFRKASHSNYVLLVIGDEMPELVEDFVELIRLH